MSAATAARNGIDVLINDAPTLLAVLRKPRVDGGMGQNVPYGELQEIKRYRCRIGRDPGRLQDPKAQSIGMPAGNDDFYVVAPWFAKLLTNDILQEPDGTQWKVGIVSYSKASGQVFAVKAPIQRVSGPVAAEHCREKEVKI